MSTFRNTSVSVFFFLDSQKIVLLHVDAKLLPCKPSKVFRFIDSRLTFLKFYCTPEWLRSGKDEGCGTHIMVKLGY